MVRYCAVADCKTGRVERQNGKENKIKKPSVFKVPKDPEMLRKWSQALSQELNSNKFVCEKHFNEQDIWRKDIINMPDGTSYISDRDKITLKPGAIPTLCRNRNVFAQSVAERESQQTIMAEAPVDNQQNAVSQSAAESQQTIKAEAPVDNQAMPLDYSSSEPDTESFSINQLIDTLRVERLPQKWCWTIDHLDSSTIILAYLDYKTLDLKFRVKIGKDLNIMVTNVKTNHSIDIDFVITCLDDFWKLLTQMQSWRFCSGSGFDIRRSSSTCKVILLNDEYKKQAEIYRCDSCRKLRMQLSRSYKPPLNTYQRHNKKVRNQLFLEKRRYKRLTSKNDKFKKL